MPPLPQLPTLETLFSPRRGPVPSQINQPLPLEEEQSLLSTLGKGALTGLGYVGGVLDKLTGGRAVRGLLGGRPRELLSVLPGSDVFGITDPGQEVSGRQLMENIGAVDPEQEGEGLLSSGNLLGIGADILLSPGTYMGLGGNAVAKGAGEAARKAGLRLTRAERLAGLTGQEIASTGGSKLEVLAKAMGKSADELREVKLGGDVGFGLPFMGNNLGTVDLSGLGTAARAVGDAISSLPYIGGPIAGAAGAIGGGVADLGRSAAALFKKSRMGQINPGLIEAAEEASSRTPGFLAKLREEELLPLREVTHGMDQRTLLDVLENKILPSNQQEVLAKTMWEEMSQKNLAEKVKRGMEPFALDEELGPGFVPRQRSYKLQGVAESGAQKVAPGRDVAREKIYKGMFTSDINDFILNDANWHVPVDPADLSKGVSQVPQAERLETIKRGLIRLTPQQELEVAQLKAQRSLGQVLNSAQEGKIVDVEAKLIQAQKFEDWSRSVPRDVVKEAGGYFDTSTQAIIEAKMMRDGERFLKADFVHDGIARTAVAGMAGEAGYLPLPTVLFDSGLALGMPGSKVPTPGPTAMVATRRAFSRIHNIPLDQADLAGYAVPESVAGALKKTLQIGSGPSEAKPIMDLLENVTNLTKQFQTLGPQTFTRNRMSDFYAKYVHGAYDPNVPGGALNPWAYIKPWWEAKKILAGEGVESLRSIKGFESLTAQEATQALHRELLSWNLAKGQQTTEMLGRDAYAITKELPIPGEALSEGVGAQFKKIKGEGSLNPLAVQGVGGRETSTFGPVAVQRGLEDEMDKWSKVSTYTAKRMQGFAPEGAYQATMGAHYDFCVDEETEILTKAGWKKRLELAVGDEVLVLDKDSRQIKWEPLQNIHVFKAPPKLVRFKTNRVDALTTVNHRWLARGCGVRGGHWSVRPEAGSQLHFTTTGECLESHKVLVLGGGLPLADVQVSPFTDEFVSLVGWVLTDGWFHGSCKWAVGVGQSHVSHPELTAKIRKLKDHYAARAITATECVLAKRGMTTFYFGKGIGELVRQVMGPKKQLLMSFLTLLPARQLQILYDALIDGDSSLTNNGTRIFAQVDKRRADAFQAVAAMLGKRTGSRFLGGCHKVTIYQSDVAHADAITKTFEDYDGFVWCPETPSGTWMARRNGKTYWTGNSNLTDFERKYMRKLVPFYCVPEEAEILTRRGWLKVDDLVVGEEVLTYEAGGDKLEWKPCLDKAVFDHDQELLEFQSVRKTFAFTPGHHWPVRRAKQTVKRDYGVYHYPEKTEMVAGQDLIGVHAFIQHAPYLDGESILTPDQARLLGWLMTDGHYRWRGNHLEAVLSQHPKKFLAEVRLVAGGGPRKPHPNGTVAVQVIPSLLKPLIPYLDKDKLPEVVTRLSRPAAEAMYDAMYKADGCVSATHKGDFFAKDHPGVRDAMQILAFLTGRTSKQNKRGLYLSKKRFLKVQSGRIVAKHYRGRVWCPRTGNGTWVMRQNGIVLITGNSWVRQNTAGVLQQIIESPGGKMATAAKVSSELGGQDRGLLPTWVTSGVAIPVGGEEEGTQRYLSKLGLQFEDIGQLLGEGLRGPLGAVNPLLKAPLEIAANRQFFSGRDLTDLYSRTGAPAPLENLLMNSPLGRGITTASTLTDPRKDWGTALTNLTTGIRLQDVDLAKARATRERQILEDVMGGSPNIGEFTNLYVRPGQEATPQEMAQMRLYRSLQARRQQARRAQEGQVAVPGR